jgi:hypothetical protein
MTGRTEANHRFLALRQPLSDADFPSPRIFEAGRVYKFPFAFTIPAQLLPKSCTHPVVSDQVRDTHLLLPPSLGDPDLAGFGNTLLDDLAPDMSKIVYGIKVRIAHQRLPDGAMSILAERTKKVRVKPAFEEQAPLNIDGNDEYRPKQSKRMKKGLFKGRLGTLTAQTVQPRPLVIPGARTSNNKPIATVAKLVIRFDPADESYAPPKLSSLATKLKVSTHYASCPRQRFPTRSTLGFDMTQGIYSESVPLSTLCIASAQWEKHLPDPTTTTPPSPELTRRDSGVSTCSTSSASAFASGILAPSKDYKNGPFYTSTIQVPVSLTTKKNFIPTFHSCLISRSYTLSITFAPQAGPTLHLKVPVQICADGSDTGIENARARSVEESVLREAADMFFPRSVAPPPEFNGRRPSGSPQPERTADLRLDMPPEYATIASSRPRAHVQVAA